MYLKPTSLTLAQCDSLFSPLSALYTPPSNPQTKHTPKKHAEVRSILMSARAQVKTLLTERLDQLHALAGALVEHETLNSGQIKVGVGVWFGVCLNVGWSWGAGLGLLVLVGVAVVMLACPLVCYLHFGASHHSHPSSCLLCHLLSLPVAPPAAHYTQAVLAGEKLAPALLHLGLDSSSTQPDAAAAAGAGAAADDVAAGAALDDQ